jgi:hypothetical protein
MPTKVQRPKGPASRVNVRNKEFTDTARHTESFLLFSQRIPSHNLGFIDPKAQTIDLTLAGKDISIRQSPGLLSSNRKEGTTGAGM